MCCDWIYNDIDYAAWSSTPTLGFLILEYQDQLNCVWSKPVCEIYFRIFSNTYGIELKITQRIVLA